MAKSDIITSTIHAKDIDISVITSVHNEDFFSLTDIARYKNPEFPADVIKNWLRVRSTIEYLGLWEQLHNPNFKLVEFDQFKNEAGSNSFVLSPQKWVTSTNAIGIVSKSGRYNGGTFAHKDIAFEFASWVSPEFKLYVIQDYQRLKSEDSHRLALDWNVKRLLSKANYKIHTDAIKKNLIPPNLHKQKQPYIYASEADILNLALFGKTASEWRKENPDKKGENIRDCASIEQLLVLANLENINALLIESGISKEERLLKLNAIAINQMTALSENKSVTRLSDLHNQPQALLENHNKNE
ncbi:MAG: KilA-N domain-containing protein [Clostridia bacterium]|nr:KilA-N domain-containing protein [Clostridia bacterium]